MSQTILCIEDNPDNALILESVLERAGYKTYVARDGDVAIRFANQHQLDLILCDFHLPGENAPEVIRRIRQYDHLYHVPVVILTADMYNGPESHAIGIAAYINKPIKPEYLIRTIKRILL